MNKFSLFLLVSVVSVGAAFEYKAAVVKLGRAAQELQTNFVEKGLHYNEHDFTRVLQGQSEFSQFLSPQCSLIINDFIDAVNTTAGPSQTQVQQTVNCFYGIIVAVFESCMVNYPAIWEPFSCLFQNFLTDISEEADGECVAESDDEAASDDVSDNFGEFPDLGNETLNATQCEDFFGSQEDGFEETICIALIEPTTFINDGQNFLNDVATNFAGIQSCATLVALGFADQFNFTDIAADGGDISDSDGEIEDNPVDGINAQLDDCNLGHEDFIDQFRIKSSANSHFQVPSVLLGLIIAGFASMLN